MVTPASNSHKVQPQPVAIPKTTAKKTLCIALPIILATSIAIGAVTVVWTSFAIAAAVSAGSLAIGVMISSIIAYKRSKTPSTSLSNPFQTRIENVIRVLESIENKFEELVKLQGYLRPDHTRPQQKTPKGVELLDARKKAQALKQELKNFNQMKIQADLKDAKSLLTEQKEERIKAFLNQLESRYGIENLIKQFDQLCGVQALWWNKFIDAISNLRVTKRNSNSFEFISKNFSYQIYNGKHASFDLVFNSIARMEVKSDGPFKRLICNGITIGSCPLEEIYLCTKSEAIEKRVIELKLNFENSFMTKGIITSLKPSPEKARIHWNKEKQRLVIPYASLNKSLR